MSAPSRITRESNYLSAKLKSQNEMQNAFGDDGDSRMWITWDECGANEVVVKLVLAMDPSIISSFL